MKTDFLTKIVAHKKLELADAKKRVALESLAGQARQRNDIRPFAARFKKERQNDPDHANIIAEIKRASPSKGLFRADLDPASYAAAYENGGAAALSVLTDETFFKGSLDDLKAARKNCSLPVLRKDFIIDEYQIFESAAAGADAILLIVRILSPEQLQHYLALSHELGLDALVEIFAADELAVATAAGAELIGINNRNLKTFVTDIGHAMQLATRFKANQIPVALSGIQNRADIEANLKSGIFNFLIGESLVKAADPVSMLKTLSNAIAVEKEASI